MPHKILIVVNSVEEFDCEEDLDRYLTSQDIEYSVDENFPVDSKNYDLVVLWNYRKIISRDKLGGNVIVFHASNLPEGKGWAPIYYAVAEGRKEYTLSGLLASENVDEGEIIIKATFPISDEYTAPFLRVLDNKISIILISKIIFMWPKGKIRGSRQLGSESFRKRRYPQDNFVDISKSLKELTPHLRAVENNAPAYFFINNVKYIIIVKPEQEPNYPEEVKIIYPFSGEVEFWSGW
jgi:methionyl-tRNA formyltransferase